MKQQKAHYCFKQEAGSDVHKLYIYDDVSEYGTFDWWTWEYTENETSAEFFRKALAEIPDNATIELHINSYGGSVKEGIAIYNQLKQKKCKEIVAYVDGYAFHPFRSIDDTTYLYYAQTNSLTKTIDWDWNKYKSALICIGNIGNGFVAIGYYNSESNKIISLADGWGNLFGSYIKITKNTVTNKMTIVVGPLGNAVNVFLIPIPKADVKYQNIV